MRNKLIIELKSKILNQDLIHQLDNDCDFNNVNYLEIRSSVNNVIGATYTDFELTYDEFKTNYSNLLSDYFEKIDLLIKFNENQCEQIINFLDMPDEMEEKIRDQVLLFARQKTLIKKLPNLSGRLVGADGSSVLLEINKFIECSTSYIKNSYSTFNTVNNFIFNGLSDHELTLIDLELR